jgi:hypothetical protein
MVALRLLKAHIVTLVSEDFAHPNAGNGAINLRKSNAYSFNCFIPKRLNPDFLGIFMK